MTNLRKLKVNKKYLFILLQIFIGSNAYPMMQLNNIWENFSNKWSNFWNTQEIIQTAQTGDLYCPKNNSYSLYNPNLYSISNELNSKELGSSSNNSKKTFKSYNLNANDMIEKEFQMDEVSVNLNNFLSEEYKLSIQDSIDKILQENIDLDNLDESKKSNSISKAIDYLLIKNIKKIKAEKNYTSFLSDDKSNDESNEIKDIPLTFFNKNMNFLIDKYIFDGEDKIKITETNKEQIIDSFLDKLLDNLEKYKNNIFEQNIESLINIKMPILDKNTTFIDSRLSLFKQMKNYSKEQIKRVEKIINNISNEYKEQITVHLLINNDEIIVLSVKPQTCKYAITENAKNTGSLHDFIQYSRNELPCNFFLDYNCKYRKLLEKIMDNEHKLIVDDKYYVFYHGQDKINLIFQELIKELAIQLYGIPETDLKDFVYLRYPSLNYSTTNMKDLFGIFDNSSKFENHFLTGKWFDSRPDIKKILLSVNTNLFGQYFDGGESSLYYFMKNHSDSEINISYIAKKILKKLDMYYEPEISTLENNLKEIYKYLSNSEIGMLLQIAVPKEDVPLYAYQSYAYGQPTETSTELGKTLSQECNGKKYEDFQSRLLITNECVLNPYKTKIFRYTNLQSNILEKINSKIKNLVTDLLNKKPNKQKALPSYKDNKIETSSNIEQSNKFEEFINLNKQDKTLVISNFIQSGKLKPIKVLIKNKLLDETQITIIYEHIFNTWNEDSGNEDIIFLINNNLLNEQQINLSFEKALDRLSYDAGDLNFLSFLIQNTYLKTKQVDNLLTKILNTFEKDKNNKFGVNILFDLTKNNYLTNEKITLIIETMIKIQHASSSNLFNKLFKNNLLNKEQIDILFKEFLSIFENIENFKIDSEKTNFKGQLLDVFFMDGNLILNKEQINIFYSKILNLWNQGNDQFKTIKTHLLIMLMLKKQLTNEQMNFLNNKHFECIIKFLIEQNNTEQLKDLIENNYFNFDLNTLDINIINSLLEYSLSVWEKYYIGSKYNKDYDADNLIFLFEKNLLNTKQIDTIFQKIILYKFEIFNGKILPFFIEKNILSNTQKDIILDIILKEMMFGENRINENFISKGFLLVDQLVNNNNLNIDHVNKIISTINILFDENTIELIDRGFILLESLTHKNLLNIEQIEAAVGYILKYKESNTIPYKLLLKSLIKENLLTNKQIELLIDKKVIDEHTINEIKKYGFI